MKVSPLVRIEIDKRYGSVDAAEAVRVLAATELPLLEAEGRAADRTRVHLAILKLAAGKLAALGEAARQASVDWRDVLVAAGLADENWRDVLAASGFGVPSREPPEGGL